MTDRVRTPVAPLTHAQARLWFRQRVDPSAIESNQAALWAIDGPLDEGALAAALDAVTARQPMLRTRFPVEDGAPVQRVDAPPRAPLERVDLAATDDAADAALEDAARERSRRPFDLAADTAFRWTLFARGGGRHALLLAWHHVGADAFSIRTIARDLQRAYAAVRRGDPSPLPPLAHDFHQYTRWLAAELATPAAIRDLEAARARFEGATDLALPYDFRRPAVPTLRSEVARLDLPAAARERFVAVARTLGVPPGSAFLAAWTLLLGRLSGEPDVVVGIATKPWPDPSWADVVGLFAELAPVRPDLGRSPSVADAMRRTRDAVQFAFDSRRVPFDRLVGALARPRANDRPALCQAGFVMRPARLAELELEGCVVRRIPLRASAGGFELTLRVDDGDDGVSIGIEGAADLYARSTIERMARQYLSLLEAIATDREARPASLPLGDATVRRAILAAARGPEHPVPEDGTIASSFARQAAATPSAPAVGALDYRSALLAARALARALGRAGVAPGDRVAVGCERADQRIVAWLAVLEAGACYVPVDADSPDARLATMFAAAGVTHAVADAALAGRLARLRVAVVDPALADVPPGDDDDAARPPRRPDDPACVFFTSGSTGRPKGVLVSHRSILRLARGTDPAAVGAGDVVALLAPAAFDASTFEVWGALLNGARIVPVDRATAVAPRRLAAAIASEGVTTLFLTTALFEAVAREAPASFADLRTVLFGGETCDPRRVADVLRAGPPRRLVHVYGPTEATTFATFHEVRPIDERAAAIPIGRPLADVEVHVLRDDGEPADPGEPGEIVIGGAGVALGYLGATPADDGRFANLGPCGGAPRRFYRTGDRAYRRDDGALVFLGRRDGQVKIRGHRVELGEVEAALAGLPGVAAAAAAVLGEGSDDRRIVACLVPADPDAPPPADTRRALRARLPAVMVPAELVWLRSLPLNANGKVDRRAFEALVQAPAVRDAGADAPRDPLEADIVRRWEALLGRRGLGLRDRFFESGGHSLLAARFADEYERDTGFVFPLAQFFVDDSVEQVAQAIRVSTFRANRAVSALHEDGRRLPLVYAHGDFMAGGFHGHALARWLGDDQPLYLVHPHGIGDRALPTTVPAMAEERLAALRALRPHGPWVVGGHCNGAFLAFEMACQLRAAGEAVAAVVVVDAWAPGTRDPHDAAAIRESLAAAGFDAPTDRMSDLAHRSYRAMLDYRPARFDGRLVFVRSEHAANDYAPGWARLASGVEVRTLPGTHTSLVVDENARGFAAVLAEVVAAAEAGLAGDRPPVAAD